MSITGSTTTPVLSLMLVALLLSLLSLIPVSKNIRTLSSDSIFDQFATQFTSSDAEVLRGGQHTGLDGSYTFSSSNLIDIHLLTGTLSGSDQQRTILSTIQRNISPFCDWYGPPIDGLKKIGRPEDTERDVEVFWRLINDSVNDMCTRKAETSRYGTRTFSLILGSKDVHLFPEALESIERVLQQLLRIHGHSSTLPAIILDYLPPKRWMTSDLSVEKGPYLIDALHRYPFDHTGELWQLPSDFWSSISSLASHSSILAPRFPSLLIDCQSFNPISTWYRLRGSDLVAKKLNYPNHLPTLDEPLILYPPIAGVMISEFIQAGIHDLNTSGMPSPWPPLPKETIMNDLMATFNGLGLRKLFNHIKLIHEAWYHDKDISLILDAGAEIWPLVSRLSQSPSTNIESPEWTMLEIAIDPRAGYPNGGLKSSSSTGDDAMRHQYRKLNASSDLEIVNTLVPPSDVITSTDEVFENAEATCVPVDDPLVNDAAPPRPMTTYQSPGLSHWLPSEESEKLSEQHSNARSWTSGTRYAVVSLVSQTERQLLQDYVWRAQGIDIHHFKGLDFGDSSSLRSHFGCSTTESELEDLMKNGRPQLLVQNEMLAARKACIDHANDTGEDVGAVVFVEDDGFPLDDSQSRIERTIDMLQALYGPDGWGYHSTGAAQMFSLNERVDWTIKRYRSEISSDPLDFPSSVPFESLLPYDGNTAIIRTLNTGTYGQIINCQRFKYVHDTFFLDPDQDKTPDGAYRYRGLSNQFENFKRVTRLKETWSHYVADRAYIRMFFENEGTTKAQDGLTRELRNFTTFSIDPIINLSPLEWATMTNLHSVKRPTSNALNHDTLASSHSHQVSEGFPNMEVVMADGGISKYFLKHMFITRKNLCRRGIVDWLREIVDNSLQTTLVAVGLTRDQRFGLQSRAVYPLLWELFSATETDHVEMQTSEPTTTDAITPFDYNTSSYYPCLLGDTIPNDYTQYRVEDKVVVKTTLSNRTRTEKVYHMTTSPTAL